MRRDLSQGKYKIDFKAAVEFENYYYNDDDEEEDNEDNEQNAQGKDEL